MSVIEVSNLKKYFGKTRAVDGLSFEVEKGEIFGFLGPNGAGKTTTIRCLLDFLRPSAGEIKMFGLDSRKHGPEIKKKIGYLSGDVRLYDGWTGEEHLRFLESLRGKKSIGDELAAKLALNTKTKFKALSSGNKQKLGLVLALSFEPELLIMDEPTLGLDPLLQNQIYELLEESQKRGATIFMSSHNLAEVDRLCHRVGIIKEGRLIAIESIQVLKEKRMHVAKVIFSGPFNSQDFLLPNVEIRSQLPDGLILGITGDINPLIQRLAAYPLRELEISYASLEEIFLEFYGGSSQPSQNQNNNLQEIPKLE